MLIGPCALTTVGATTVAAVTAAAPRRNFRRVADLDVRNASVVMGMALLGFPRASAGLLGAAWDINRADSFLIPVAQVVRRGMASHKVRIVSPPIYRPWRVASLRARVTSTMRGPAANRRGGGMPSRPHCAPASG